MGNSTVILGAPRPSQGPYPTPSPMEIPYGVQRAPRVTAQDLLLETALPEGEHRHPVSGFDYFPCGVKLRGIKTLELVFPDAVVKLR